MIALSRPTLTSRWLSGLQFRSWTSGRMSMTRQYRAIPFSWPTSLLTLLQFSTLTSLLPKILPSPCPLLEIYYPRYSTILTYRVAISWLSCHHSQKQDIDHLVKTARKERHLYGLILWLAGVYRCVCSKCIIISVHLQTLLRKDHRLLLWTISVFFHLYWVSLTTFTVRELV